MATDYSDKRNKLEDEIVELETAATGVKKPTLPSVKLDQIVYAPPTDAELRESAERELAGYKQDGELNIRENSAAGAKELAAKRETYASSLEKDVAALENDYGAAAERIDADVIKRGLARSSIAVNAKSGLEGERMRQTAAVRDEYGKRIAELDAQISAVGAKLTAALNDFNLSYAAKLNETLGALKTEREQNTQAAIKYNNEVKAKQAMLDAQKAKTESDMYTAAIKQNQAASDVSLLSEAEREKVYSAVFAKLDSYLSSLSEEQARIELRNYPMYRTHLNDYYYYKLYDRYARQ